MRMGGGVSCRPTHPAQAVILERKSHHPGTPNINSYGFVFESPREQGGWGSVGSVGRARKFPYLGDRKNTNDTPGLDMTREQQQGSSDKGAATRDQLQGTCSQQIFSPTCVNLALTADRSLEPAIYWRNAYCPSPNRSRHSKYQGGKKGSIIFLINWKYPFATQIFSDFI